MSTFIRDKPRFPLTALWVKPEPASDEKLTNFQKAWRIIALDHFTNVKKA